MPPAVIFDIDGVLVDSHESHFESWQHLARETGHAMTREAFATTFGRTSRDIIAILFDPDLTEEAIAALDDRKESLYRAIISRSFPAMPHAAALVTELADDGWRIGAGSSASPENVSLTLELLGVSDLFHCAVTGADVTRGKPDPEVFLKAATQLSCDPSTCVVIEDAAPGIEAARAAGMAVVGFASHGRTIDELAAAGADEVVSSLQEISSDWLGRVIGSGLRQADGLK